MNTDEHGWRKTANWRRALLPLLGERAGVRAGQPRMNTAKQSRRSNVEFPLLRGVRVGFRSAVGFWMLYGGCWMLDVGCSTFNVQRSMPPGTFAACSGRRQSALTSLEMSGLTSAATRFNGRADVPSGIPPSR